MNHINLSVIIMKWQKATVFISSTFNDMHAERDYLIKEVFPELTEWCEERKIRLSDVDLRWGVKEEDSENNATVGTCLRHIDKSRPFFLCFLGQRRGWVPDFENDINEDTKEQYPTIKSIDTDRSVTEMEIEHSLLSPLYRILEKEGQTSCPPTRHSLFFFRDPEYVNEISPAQRLIYTNENEEDVAHADEKLAEIKQRIIDKKAEETKENANRADEEKIYVDITDYKGTWDSELELPELSHYKNGEGKGRLTNFKCGERSLKEVLLQQLKAQLEAEFPENMEPSHNQSELERDLDQQDIFCYLSSEGFIPRPTYTKHLEDYVKNSHDNKICLVSAEAGYGKTMLLAKFATDFENDEENDVRLYKRFCGASDLSSQTYSLWKSIIDEAKISPDEEFYPKNLEELKRNVTEILDAIAGKGKSLIIIDAINQMTNGMDMLKWLGKLPDNLKIIISIKEDRNDEKYNENLKRIKQRNNICGFEIKELDDHGKRDLIKVYLSNYLKALDEEQIDTICGFEASKIPLFLKILLSELRVFGSFDQLKGKITMFGDSPKSAFDHVLERLEEDEKLIEGENIVPLMFSLLANARVGLSEDELKAIIKTQTNASDKEIQDSIRINLRQMRPFMARKEGRHDFFYESFKLAAKERYGDDKLSRNDALASYFMAKADPGNDYTFNVAGENENEKLRPLNELPYHLNEAEDYEKLSDVLSSFAFIKNKIELSDVYNLILDYQFGQDHKFNQKEDHPIILIGRALELSSPVLDKNKDQLSAQLWGRMCEIDDETIQKLIRELDGVTSDRWLKSKDIALYSPKSSIIKRINPDGKKSTTTLLMANDNEIVIGSEDGMLNIFDINNNELQTLDEGNSKVIKAILNEDGTVLVANEDGTINEWDINNKMIVKEYPKIDAQITDIYLSKTYGKIYASSHEGIFTINLETNELRREDIENKNYNQILVPRRNEAILVCDEKEVDGWDVYEMRKAYNRHHQQNQEEEESEKAMDSSEEIRFMGLNKRFLTLISENGQMKFWNTLKNSGGGESIDEEFVCSGNDKFKQAITLENENQIITLSEMGVLKVYDIPNPRQPKFNMVKEIQTGIRAPTAMDYYSNDESRWVIVGNQNNDVSVIDLEKKVEESEVDKHNDTVLSIKLHDNNMITASENGEVFTWNFTDEDIESKFENDFRSECISYNYDESKLASAGVRHKNDGKVINKIATWKLGDEEAEDYRITSDKVIDIAQNSSEIVFIEENSLTVGDDETKLDKTATTLATIFDSDEIFVGFEDGSIVKYPSQSSFDKANDSEVRKIKISGDKLIAGFGDGAIEIFDLSGRHIKTLKGHEKAITNINIDGSQLISASEDNTIKFWNIDDDEPEYTYFLDIYATSINFRNGKLVIGDTLGNVRFFEFEN